MKLIRFLADFYSVDGTGNCFVKYAKGGIYPLDDETAGQVAAGFAEEVDTLEGAPAVAVAPAPASAPATGSTKPAGQSTDGA